MYTINKNIKKLTIILLITELLLISFFIIKYHNKIYIKKVTNYNLNISKKEIPIGKIIIKKINLAEDIYGKESKKNNIEEHVAILKPSNYPKLLILAAHSGIGKIAYFEELDKLNIDDEITIIYNKDKTIYKITKIWEEPKNGKIHINNENNQLILTTCSPHHNKYQLIISCKKKESI